MTHRLSLARPPQRARHPRPRRGARATVELTGGAFYHEQELLVVAQTMQPDMPISYVARRSGLSLTLVFRWSWLMSEGGREAVRADDVVPVAEMRRMEERVRDLERTLGHKTLEVEILKEAAPVIGAS